MSSYQLNGSSQVSSTWLLQRLDLITHRNSVARTGERDAVRYRCSLVDQGFDRSQIDHASHAGVIVLDQETWTKLLKPQGSIDTPSTFLSICRHIMCAYVCALYVH